MRKRVIKALYRSGTIFVILLIVILVKQDMTAAGWMHSLVINLADAELTLVGEDEGDWAAYFASPAGDVNGDGLGDAFIGAPMAGEKVCPYPLNPDGSCPGLAKGQGVAYLVLGRTEELPSGPVSLADAEASFLGCEISSMTARQLYTAGDVNGDGFDDLLISGWKCGENFTGIAYLFLGRQDVSEWGRFFPVAQADASFLGENEKDFLSYYVSTAGDINGDGYDDFLITSTHYDIPGDPPVTDAGKVYLMLGRENPNWGNNYDLSNADASFLGSQEGDRIGRSAVGVGDVNGDGYDDILIGAKSSDTGGIDAGENYLFLGRATQNDPNYDPVNKPWWGNNFPVGNADASFIGEAEYDESGRRVANAGDVNGDGLSDMLMQAALNDYAGPDAGIAYLVLGREAADWGKGFSLSNADASFIGEDRRDQAGRRLSGAGDVNDDGYDDFLIGAPHFSEEDGVPDSDDTPPITDGRAYLIFGRPEADWGLYYPLSLADVIHIGKPDVGVAGYDIAWLDDFNGDQIDDYLIAAYGGRNNWSVPGEAYVILGSATPKPVQFLPDLPMITPNKWQRFTGEYWDPNSWSDIEVAELVLEETGNSGKGIKVRYIQSNNELFLWDSVGSDWVGPCIVGTPGILDNGKFHLDCQGSSILNDDEHVLRVMWRGRWINNIGFSQTFLTYLRSIDEKGNDSQYWDFGIWGIPPNQLFLPAVLK